MSRRQPGTPASIGPRGGEFVSDERDTAPIQERQADAPAVAQRRPGDERVIQNDFSGIEFARSKARSASRGQGECQTPLIRLAMLEERCFRGGGYRRLVVVPIVRGQCENRKVLNKTGLVARVSKHRDTRLQPRTRAAVVALRAQASPPAPR